jgi:hypothetical protein
VTRLSHTLKLAKRHDMEKEMRTELQNLWRLLETSYSKAYDNVVRDGMLGDKFDKKTRKKIQVLLEPPEVPSAWLTLHFTKLCTNIKNERKKIVLVLRLALRHF